MVSHGITQLWFALLKSLATSIAVLWFFVRADLYKDIDYCDDYRYELVRQIEGTDSAFGLALLLHVVHSDIRLPLV